ncbi:MAG: GNAT family N-acetyltransferase [Acidimicrobiales bacterium]
MPAARSEPMPEPPLAGGLVLRSARAGDRDAILALEVQSFGESDGPIVRSRLDDLDGWLVVEDPAAPDHVAGGIASASVLLAHRLRLGEVELPVGQIENVATHPRYRRRRLVRSQFEVHHARSAERGDLAGLITGIPYLYRRLGYGYGLDYPAIHLPTATDVGDAGSVEVRPARDGDLEGIARLDSTRPTAQLRVVRDAASWRRTLARSGTTRFEQLVVAERDDDIVGFAQLEARPTAERLYVLPAMAADAEAAHALLAHAVAQASGRGELVVAFDNPGTTCGEVLDGLGDPVRHSHGIYVRVPDAVALLDALRPVLSQRLAASRYADRLGRLSISLYESGVSVGYDAGVVTDVAPADGVEDPFDSGDVGVPPDLVGALALGRFGATELERRVDDVTLGRHRGLMEVLFPKVEAEVLADL